MNLCDSILLLSWWRRARGPSVVFDSTVSLCPLTFCSRVFRDVAFSSGLWCECSRNLTSHLCPFFFGFRSARCLSVITVRLIHSAVSFPTFLIRTVGVITSSHPLFQPVSISWRECQKYSLREAACCWPCRVFYRDFLWLLDFCPQKLKCRYLLF